MVTGKGQVSHWLRPVRTRQSALQTPAATIFTSTWPGPGVGFGRSTYFRTSGPPNSSNTTAFTGRPPLDRSSARARSRRRPLPRLAVSRAERRSARLEADTDESEVGRFAGISSSARLTGGDDDDCGCAVPGTIRPRLELEGDAQLRPHAPRSCASGSRSARAMRPTRQSCAWASASKGGPHCSRSGSRPALRRS